MPSRRLHSKSRRGCGQCKGRRIKCDEKPPCCGPCSRKGIACDYQEMAIIYHHPEHGTASHPLSGSQTSDSPRVPHSSPGPHDALGNFSIHDLGLMHHFTLRTSQTLGVVNDDVHRVFWQQQAPLLALKYEFLAYALLSVTAAHVAVSGDARTSELVSISQTYYGSAIASFRKSVKVVDAEQMDAVYCFCVLFMIATFSYGVVDACHDRDPIIGIMEVFGVVRTAANMLHDKQDILQESKVIHLLRHLDDVNPHEPQNHVKYALDNLTRLLANSQSERSAVDNIILQDAAEKLRKFFTLVDTRPLSSAFLLQWPILLPADFLDLLERMEGPALALLSFWCAPVHHSPPKWYIGSSMRRLVYRIAQILEGTVWRNAIEWPMAQVSSEDS